MCLQPIIDFGYTFEHAVTAMIIIQLDGTILQSNHSAQRMFECTNDELPSLFHKENNYQNLQDILSTFLDNQDHTQPYVKLEQYYHLHSNRVIYTSTILSLTNHLSSSDPLIFVQYLDVTDQKTIQSRIDNNEIKLEVQPQSYQRLLEELQSALFIISNGTIQFINRAGLDLIGATTKEEVIGHSAIDYIDKYYHRIVQEHQVMVQNMDYLGSVRYRIIRLDGTYRFVDGFSLPITYQHKDARLSVFNDVTHLLREEERLMQSEKLSIAGQLAAGIAHEIRNPLTSISGFMKLIRSTKRNEERYFSIVESELKRIELIVNELLILSKPYQSYDKKPTDLISLLDQVITLMTGQAAMKNIQILFCTHESEIWIHGEANQLKQVFINLIKNAIEAMTITGEITVHLYVVEHTVHVTVQDSGSGISPEQLKQIGIPFFTTKDTGTGLGLMICYNIIHNHDGEIQVDSVLNQGTTFSVILPLLS